jgi:regulator of sigma E protease
MSPGLLHSLLSHFWSIFLMVFFFGGSIFVHELGHFLAARRRGLVVQRFSIGMGPAIPGCTWHGKDGVEYCLAWFPIGGYVLMPQFADLGLIEGGDAADAAKLPPIDYASKMIVSVAGATFNIAFAFLLACIVWAVGQQLPDDSQAAARIGYLAKTLTVADGGTVTSPAAEAGLRVGDFVRAIDGQPVANWAALQEVMVTGSGRDATGRPEAVFTLERDGRRVEVTVHPRISKEDRVRKIGIDPWYDVIVAPFAKPDAAGEKTLGEKLGFREGDQILSFDGVPVMNWNEYQDYLTDHRDQAVAARVKHGAEVRTIVIPPRPEDKAAPHLGLVLTRGFSVVHLSPFTQIAVQIQSTLRTLSSLLNPRSDVGPSSLTGPIGIVHILNSAAEEGLLVVVNFSIMINVCLAIFNLLPIPVLDGGHMLFATIARLRGRALPISFIVNTQVAFSVLLLSMFVYISVFDVKRWASDAHAEHAAAAAAAVEKP